jgi:hypothetical protein
MEHGIIPEAMESLRLPTPFDEATLKAALDIHTFLKQDEGPPATLDAKLAAHREAALSHLLTLRGKRTFGRPAPLLDWPSWLYIPHSANASDYFPAPAPDDNRYAQAFTFPTDSPNTASREDGSLYSFCQLNNTNPSFHQTNGASGVGINYTSLAFNEAIIEVMPHVECSGTLRTFLEFFPLAAAGYVEVTAQLLLVAYEVLGTGLNQIGLTPFDVATLRRDQSSGPEEDNFQNSFHGPNLSATFQVAGSPDPGAGVFPYMFVVESRILVTSTLSTINGGALPPIDNSKLKVWGVITSTVGEIDVRTQQIIS